MLSGTILMRTWQWMWGRICRMWIYCFVSRLWFINPSSGCLAYSSCLAQSSEYHALRSRRDAHCWKRAFGERTTSEPTVIWNVCPLLGSTRPKSSTGRKKMHFYFLWNPCFVCCLPVFRLYRRFRGEDGKIFAIEIIATTTWWDGANHEASWFAVMLSVETVVL